MDSELSQAALSRAARTGQPVRLHLEGGEVLVARVLNWDGHEVVYTVITSSRPERYAICDATGFSVTLDDISRTTLLRDPDA